MNKGQKRKRAQRIEKMMKRARLLLAFKPWTLADAKKASRGAFIDVAVKRHEIYIGAVNGDAFYMRWLAFLEAEDFTYGVSKPFRWEEYREH